MIKHTPYIIEYPRFVDPRTTAILQEQASVLLQFDPKNSNHQRKNRGYYLEKYKHIDGMQELNWEVNKISKKAFLRYHKDCPLITYNFVRNQDFFLNNVYRFYDKSDHYNWHVDHCSDHMTFVVSFLLYLNDGFGGGDTLFLNDRVRVKPQNGSVLMFPCGPYFIHKSTKVTYGQKHVMWNCFGQRARPPV